MDIDRTTLAYAKRALSKTARRFLFTTNVGLIDFGYPEHGGVIAQDELAIRIHVHRKLSEFALESALASGMTDEFPDEIDGFKVDRPEGVYQPHQWWWNGRTPTASNQRATKAAPMRAGISISNEYHHTFGTLGGKVIDRSSGAEMILSNWHVLVGDWRMRPNRRIYQPGRLDGGADADTVATLTRDAMSADLDAAVATLNGDRTLVNEQLQIGRVRGVADATLGMNVLKSGRKTGVTHGRVTAIEGTAKIAFAGINRIIQKVVTIEPRTSISEVSAGGDSGSWWLDEKTMQAVSLHFAGSNQPERALSIDMQTVLDALHVDIAK